MKLKNKPEVNTDRNDCETALARAKERQPDSPLLFPGEELLVKLRSQAEYVRNYYGTYGKHVLDGVYKGVPVISPYSKPRNFIEFCDDIRLMTPAEYIQMIETITKWKPA